MRRLLLSVLLLSLSCAGPHPWSRRSLCELDRSGGDEPGAATWIRLLIRGWDPETGRTTAPAVDCTGRQVRWDAQAVACDDPATARSLLPDRPLSEQDVVVSRLGADERLVWIVTNRYASGDGVGPAAVVTVRDRRLVVRAIGTLRANVLRARLRLEPLGGTEALVAEGESCASVDPASCVRAARVMPLLGDRFLPTAMVDASGACAGPAWIHLGREESERLPSGWRRRTRLDAAMTFGPAGLGVDEAVIVQDSDPRQPNAPARLFRKAESRLEVKLQDGRLSTSGQPLWARIKAARE